MKPHLHAALLSCLLALTACNKKAEPAVFRDKDEGVEVTYDTSAWETTEAFGVTALFCVGDDCPGLMCRIYGELDGFNWPASTDKAALQSIDAFLLDQEKSAGGKTAVTTEPTNVQTLGGRETLVNVMKRELIDNEPTTVAYFFREGDRVGLVKCDGRGKSVAAARAKMDSLAAGTRFIGG